MRTLRLSVGLWFIAQVGQSDKAEASVCIATLELVDAWCWIVGSIIVIGFVGLGGSGINTRRRKKMND